MEATVLVVFTLLDTFPLNHQPPGVRPSTQTYRGQYTRVNYLRTHKIGVTTRCRRQLLCYKLDMLCTRASAVVRLPRCSDLHCSNDEVHWDALLCFCTVVIRALIPRPNSTTPFHVLRQTMLVFYSLCEGIPQVIVALWYVELIHITKAIYCIKARVRKWNCIPCFVIRTFEQKYRQKQQYIPGERRIENRTHIVDSLKLRRLNRISVYNI